MKKILLFLVTLLILPSLAWCNGYDTGQLTKDVGYDYSPRQDDLVDLGSTSLRYKDIHISGTAYLAGVSLPDPTSIGTLILGSGSITDSSGSISVGNENILGTGTLGMGAITGTSLTDGTATLASGSLTSAVNGTFSGALQMGNGIVSDAAGLFDFTGGSSATISATGSGLLSIDDPVAVNGSLTTTPVSVPTINLYDLDGTDPDINGSFYGDLTDTGTGAEDFDMFLKQQIAGTLTTTATFDADGDITFNPTSDINLSDKNVSNVGDLALDSITADDAIRISINDDVNFVRSFFTDEMWNGIDSAWATDVTTGSAAAQARANGWYRLTTGATTTNEESIDFNDITVCVNTQRPTFEIRLDLEEVSDTEVEVGLKESEGVGTDDYIMISFDPSAQNTWFLQASTGGTPTTDQGAVADTNEVLLRFQFTSDTALEWFIDDVSQGVVASNVPTVALQPFARARTEAEAAHYIDIDYVKTWQDRS